MRYSIKPRERKYVKGYRFLFWIKNIVKSWSSKNDLKLEDRTKTLATDAFKIASKWAIQTAAETTGGLISNEIADKITKVLLSNKHRPKI